MGTQRDVVEIICQTHTEVKEKIVFLKDFLSIIDKNGVWNDTKDILGFFNRNLLAHFKNEEILISILKRDEILLQNETKLITEILEEHVIVVEELNKLNKLAERFAQNNKVIREEFIEISQKIIEEIIKHADKEDKIFFPFVMRKLKKEQLQELEKLIIKN